MVGGSGDLMQAGDTNSIALYKNIILYINVLVRHTVESSTACPWFCCRAVATAAY
jgi:mannose-6-phosphate isomerase-like protein (cupin superfamily)